MICDGIPSLSIQDIIETSLCTAFIPKPLEIQKGVADSPAGVHIDPDEPFVFRRQLVGIPIPFQETFVEAVHFLYKWDLEL